MKKHEVKSNEIEQNSFKWIWNSIDKFKDIKFCEFQAISEKLANGLTVQWTLIPVATGMTSGGKRTCLAQRWVPAGQRLGNFWNPQSRHDAMCSLADPWHAFAADGCIFFVSSVDLKVWRLLVVKSSLAHPHCCDPSRWSRTAHDTVSHLFDRPLVIGDPQSGNTPQKRLPKLTDVRQRHLAPPREVEEPNARVLAYAGCVGRRPPTHPSLDCHLGSVVILE